MSIAAPELPVTEIPPEEDDAFRLIAELKPETGSRDHELERHVALGPDGAFALLEFCGSTVRQIGPRVGFDDAVDLAAAICAGNAHARTQPHALNALALALIGGVARKQQAEAERRRQYELAKANGAAPAEARA